MHLNKYLAKLSSHYGELLATCLILCVALFVTPTLAQSQPGNSACETLDSLQDICLCYISGADQDVVKFPTLLHYLAAEQTPYTVILPQNMTIDSKHFTDILKDFLGSDTSSSWQLVSGRNYSYASCSQLTIDQTQRLLIHYRDLPKQIKTLHEDTAEQSTPTSTQMQRDDVEKVLDKKTGKTVKQKRQNVTVPDSPSVILSHLEPIDWSNPFSNNTKQPADHIADNAKSYLIAGFSLNSSGRSDESKVVIKVDLDGEPDYASFKPLKGVRAHHILKTTDGGYLVAGQDLDEKKNNVVIKVNLDGEPDYASFKPLKGVEAYHILKTMDGGYLIAGEHLGNKEGNVIIKLHSDGTIDKKFKPLKGVEAYHILKTTDGDYLIAGKQLDNKNDNAVIKVDSKGEPDYVSFTPLKGIWAHHILKMTDGGGYLIAGKRLDSKEYNVVIKIDLDGRPNYTSFKPTKGTWAYHILKTTDGGYLIAGIHIIAQKRFNSVIKVYSSGRVDTKSFRPLKVDDDLDWARYILKTTDGGYLIGWGDRPDNNVFTKIDSDGTPNYEDFISTTGEFGNFILPLD